MNYQEFQEMFEAIFTVGYSNGWAKKGNCDLKELAAEFVDLWELDFKGQSSESEEAQEAHSDRAV